MTRTSDEQAARLSAAGWKQRDLPGFANRIGPLWTLKEPSGWAYGFVATAEHLNPAGAVHGGALSALLDHALSAIAWQQLDRRPCVTVQLDMRFLAPASDGDFVVARGHLIQATGSLAFMRGTLTVDDRHVVDGSAVLRVVRQA
nr:PaaI family thioesterase [Variovorax boronicumulans]